MDTRGKKILGGIMIFSIVAAIGVTMYFTVGSSKRKKGKGKGEEEKQPLDYTQYASIKEVPADQAQTGAWMNNRDTLWGLALGSKVVVPKKAGATMSRLNDKLEKQGEVDLSVERNLGNVWGYWGGKVIVRASLGYSYPFYLVNAWDIKGSMNYSNDTGDIMQTTF
jgi:hypothetical protein